MKIVRLQPNAVIPTRQTINSAGVDLCSAEFMVLHPATRAMISTGIAIQIDEGYFGQVCSRSGLAANSGVFVLNSPGIIDSDYTGEVKVILFNSGTEPVIINAGDRIAQLVVSPVAYYDWHEVESLDETQRGSGGFGSTGR